MCGFKVVQCQYFQSFSLGCVFEMYLSFTKSSKVLNLEKNSRFIMKKHNIIGDRNCDENIWKKIFT
jgi:hypothetical protein